MRSHAALGAERNTKKKNLRQRADYSLHGREACYSLPLSGLLATKSNCFRYVHCSLTIWGQRSAEVPGSQPLTDLQGRWQRDILAPVPPDSLAPPEGDRCAMTSPTPRLPLLVRRSTGVAGTKVIDLLVLVIRISENDWRNKVINLCSKRALRHIQLQEVAQDKSCFVIVTVLKIILNLQPSS